MNIITKDIKTIKDLRKYVNSIDWYNKEWNEKDNEQFAHNLLVQREKDGVKEKAFKFSEVLFKSSISKKLQAKTYKLPWATGQVEFARRFRSNHLSNRLDKEIHNEYKDSDQSIRCYHLKNKMSFQNFYISDVFIYANEYTDEIVYVSYDRNDHWWNNFFKDSLDASIKNNFNELNRNKKWNLVLRKEEYKTISIEGKTFKEAKGKFYQSNKDIDKEHESSYSRMPNVWYVWGTTALDKLPENKSIRNHNDITSNVYVYDNDPREIGDTR